MFLRMAKVDFLWDAADDEGAPDFEALLAEFLGWRPTVRQPVLVILGQMRRFYSALYKAVKSTALLRVMPFQELADDEIARPDVVLIRWGR